MTRSYPLDFHGVPLDTKSIPQGRLNIDRKERSNPFPWNGQFSPQLVEQLLEAYANRGSFLLDPFLGSGTLLFEAGRVGLAAFGSEINPAAFKMANTYRLINLSLARRRQLVDLVADRLGEILPDSAPLFAVRWLFALLATGEGLSKPLRGTNLRGYLAPQPSPARLKAADASKGACRGGAQGRFARVPSESEGDLQDAIERTADVGPSPVYRPKSTHPSADVRKAVERPDFPH